MKLFKNK